MIRYFDRLGQPMDSVAWTRKLDDLEYKRVAKFGDERLEISTVWLGLNHNLYDNGPPLIFETMIFVHGDVDPRYDSMMWRWATEQEARDGHEVVVNAYRENRDPDEAVEQWRRASV